MTNDVKAIIDKTTTTIDDKTGDVTVTKEGRIQGFGKGLRDFATKKVIVKIEADIRVGELPEGHKDEGKYVVQIMLLPFDTRELANAFADRAIPIIEGLLGARALISQ